MARAQATSRVGRERRVALLTTQSMDVPASSRLCYGTMLHANAVSGANVLRDLREAVTNTLGGRMTRYETLLDATIERALDKLEDRAVNAGYDAVLAVRVSHPVITDGAIEIVVTGTGVWFGDVG